MLDHNALVAMRTELLARLGAKTPRSAKCRILLDTAMRTTAGLALYSLNTIKLNVRLLTANPHHIHQTFIHELAHLVAVELYGPKAKGHGSHWRSIMHQFGVEAKRTHRLDVSGLKRPHKTFNAYCTCRTHSLKTGRYNKLRRGINFRCRICKNNLTLEKTGV